MNKETIKINDTVMIPDDNGTWEKGVVVEIQDYKTLFTRKNKKIYRVKSEDAFHRIYIEWFNEDNVIKV